MSFPDFNFTPVVDGVDTYQAAHINDLQTAIQATADAVGSGGGDTIVEFSYPKVPAINQTYSAVVHIVRAAGTITGVTFYPLGIIAPDDPNQRTFRLAVLNADGMNYWEGVVAASDTVSESHTQQLAYTIPVSGTPTVTAGQKLVWDSRPTLGGIEDPGGLVVITITPS